jgi:hypothetical protein
MKSDPCKESKQLYNSTRKPYGNKGLLNNKQPELFSYFFHILMKIYNYVLFIYILMSLTTFLMYQIFEKNPIQNNLKNTIESSSENNQIGDLKIIKSVPEPIKSNDFIVSNNKNSSINLENSDNKNKKENISLLDNNQFISITYSSIYFCILIILNNIVSTNKSLSVFALFYTLAVVITMNFFTNIFNFIPFLNDINKVSFENVNIVTNTFFIFQYIFTTLNSSMLIYFIVLYLNTIGYFKYNIQDLPFEYVYHEIALRTDMMKISFNHFIISWKLNRILPGLLYTKKDYYFINCKVQEESEEFSEELYDKVDTLDNKGNNTIIYNKKNASNFSNDAIHSKSTIDSEYESLR